MAPSRHELLMGGAMFTAVVVAMGCVEYVFVNRDVHSPLLPDCPLGRFTVYVVLAFATAGVVTYDLWTLGPTLALRHGLASATLAWLCVLPLGVVSETFVRVALFGLTLSFGALLVVFLYCREGPCKYLSFPALILTVAITFNVPVNSILTRTFGAPVMFCMAYACVRLCWATVGTLMEIGGWDGLVKVDPKSEEWTSIAEEFEAACVRFSHKYDFSLSVQSIHRIATPQPLAHTDEGKRQGRRLFHGTSRENAKGIIADGFRLPAAAGMFGKGIYFADSPLKSWQYTDGNHLRTGVILLCWVELGKPKHCKTAITRLTAPPRRSLFEWVRRARRYDSVVGDDMSSGGQLRVPEYVVYDPKKAQVEYVLEISSCRSAAGP